MNDVIQSFEDRAKEVELYFRFLDTFEQPQVRLHFPGKRTHRYRTLDSDFLKILKANAFLLLYNMTESSIRNGILKIYRSLERDSHTYESVRTEIRDIWIRHNYKKVFNETASWESGRKAAKKLVEDAMNRAALTLDEKALPVMGNLDAARIRRLCELHGISTATPPNAKGGATLLTVRDQRNALAHGDLSFAECGRQFSIDQLRTIKRETILYVRSILRNMKIYANKKSYVA